MIGARQKKSARRPPRSARRARARPSHAPATPRPRAARRAYQRPPPPATPVLHPSSSLRRPRHPRPPLILLAVAISHLVPVPLDTRTQKIIATPAQPLQAVCLPTGCSRRTNVCPPRVALRASPPARRRPHSAYRAHACRPLSSCGRRAGRLFLLQILFRGTTAH
jgi:hypothetical protein